MALDLNTIKTVSVIAIGVLVLLAVLMAAIVRKIVTKIVFVVILIGLAGVVYWQRDQLTTCVQDCRCTFFGQQVDLPATITDKCA